MNRNFETDRLILRRWEESDAGSLYEYAKDPDVGPIAGWPPHQNIEESLSVIRNVLSGPEAYALCLKEDGKAIGAIELKLKENQRNDLAEQEDECELGYWLGKPFWGRGLMPEAAEELIRHAFEDLGMQKVWCGYYDGNNKSKRVQEKCGFRYQWTTQDVDVPLMHEKRIGHVNLLTREDWTVKHNLSLFDNHDNRIQYYELVLERSLEDLPERELPPGYSFVTYAPGDRDNWIEIEQSAKELSSREEGLEAFQRYYGTYENILPGRMFFVVNGNGEKIATAAAFFDIRKGDDGKNAMLHWTAVRREEQGNGLSKPLILHVLKRMKELGYRRVVIPTQTVTWLACKVYLDLGFLPVPQNAERNQMGWRIIRTLTEHPSLKKFEPAAEEDIFAAVICSERVSADEYIIFLKTTDLGSQYPEERFKERIEKLVKNVSISLVARNYRDQIVGVLFGLTDFAYWLYVTDLGVSRNYERRGIGRELMKKAHQLAGGEKDIAVYLIANEKAVPFYEKLGMKKAEDVMQYNHIEWTEFTVE